ncbi:MAG TPA: ribonuclease T2 [Pseudolabrys sp.]|nr:ribonuclease T2 [Pseudolabrys sp.]
MRRGRFGRIVQAGLLAIGVFAALAQTASAQDRRQNEPGKFDYYVLALSWSPSYCEASAERAPNRAPDQQCAGRPFAFVVHGLWPQYEKGFPSYCQVPAPRLDRAIVGSVLDLMPSPRLVFHEWDRHGTCTGLTPHAFFEAVRKARAAVKIPDDYFSLDKPRTVTPAEVTDAFVKANPDLARDDFAVVCDSKRLTEVRVCLTRTFTFRACPEVTQRACKLERMAMPALRGG